jgi:hypothetical protein
MNSSQHSTSIYLIIIIISGFGQGWPKSTASIPSHSTQAKTDFLHFKPFRSGQNQLPPFQVIPVRPKPTFATESYSSRAKNNFLYFKPFQSGKNRLSPF